LIIPSPSRR